MYHSVIHTIETHCVGGHMITKLLSEINEKLKQLNEICESKDYFQHLEKVLKQLNETNEEQRQIISSLNAKIKEKNKVLNKIIDLIKNNIDITIQIIKEQPTGNDEWIIERLNGIRNIGERKGSDKE